MIQKLLGGFMLFGVLGALVLPQQFVDEGAKPPATQAIAVSETPLSPAQIHAAQKKQQRANLPAPANYEIYYFGSERCGYCARWMAGSYRDWKRDPARRTARLHLAPEVEAFAVNRGVRGENFGRYHRVFERAFKDRHFGFPGFVLTSNDDIVDVGTGEATWNRMARKVRQEAELEKLRR